MNYRLLKEKLGTSFIMASAMLLLVCILNTENLSAKVLTKYSVTLTPVDRDKEEVVFLDKILLEKEYSQEIVKWNCKATANFELYNFQKDHTGQMKMIVLSNEKKYFPSLSNKRGKKKNDTTNLSTDFVINNANDNGQNITINETCSKTESVLTECSTTTTDSNNNTVTNYYPCYKDETTTRNQDWSCQIGTFPKENESLTYYCNLDGQKGLLETEHGIMDYLQSKRIKAQISYQSSQEKVENINCNGNEAPEDRHIISFSQGVGGHWGEDDFAFDIIINDSEKLSLPISATGLMELDVAYCSSHRDNESRDNETIKVAIDATEKDLISDDHYIPQNVLELPLKVNSKGELLFKRKNIFRQFSKKYDSAILVKVIK